MLIKISIPNLQNKILLTNKIEVFEFSTNIDNRLRNENLFSGLLYNTEEVKRHRRQIDLTETWAEKCLIKNLKKLNVIVALSCNRSCLQSNDISGSYGCQQSILKRLHLAILHNQLGVGTKNQSRLGMFFDAEVWLASVIASSLNARRLGNVISFSQVLRRR